MRLTFGVQGVDKVIAEIKKLSLEKRAQIRAAVNETAVNIQRNAKRACPVDTGRLRSSIRMEFYSNGLAAEVFTNVKYAPYVEFGTGMRGAASKTTRNAECRLYPFMAGHACQAILVSGSGARKAKV